MIPTAIKKSFQYGDLTVTMETSEIARQASGAVMISMGDTVVFVTVVCSKESEEGRDFFPMTVQDATNWRMRPRRNGIALAGRASMRRSRHRGWGRRRRFAECRG